MRIKTCKDISGIKYGRLTAIRKSDLGKHPRWLFKCECGKEKVILKFHVIRGNIKSCGCYSKEVKIALNTTHGMTKTKPFLIWQNIKNRCDNPNSKDYYLYGGRGISYCKRWEQFINFFNDMGHPPENFSIDRIDVNGNYEPSNCRWATPTEQANNRRSNVFVEFGGERRTIAEWGKILGLRIGTISARLKNGCTAEEALRKKYERTKKTIRINL
jgi:hypothetical protein